MILRVLVTDRKMKSTQFRVLEPMVECLERLFACFSRRVAVLAIVVEVLLLSNCFGLLDDADIHGLNKCVAQDCFWSRWLSEASQRIVDSSPA